MALTEHEVAGPKDASTASWTAQADFKAAAQGPNSGPTPSVDVRSAFDSARVNPSTPVFEMGAGLQQTLDSVMNEPDPIKLKLCDDIHIVGQSLEGMQPGSDGLFGALCSTVTEATQSVSQQLNGMQSSVPIQQANFNIAAPQPTTI